MAESKDAGHRSMSWFQQGSHAQGIKTLWNMMHDQTNLSLMKLVERSNSKNIYKSTKLSAHVALLQLDSILEGMKEVLLAGDRYVDSDNSDGSDSRVACKGAKSQSACSYLTSVTRFCPRGVGDAVITKLEFKKSSKSRFLLLYIKDRTAAGRKAVIRIDCRTEAQAPDQEKVSCLSSHSTSLEASPSLHGFFTITADVNTKRSDRTLSTLTFDDDSTFSADEAAMICKITSDFAQEDNIIGLWYAWMIYNVIQQTQKGHFTKTPVEDDRRIGLHSGVNKGASVPSFDTLQRLAEIYREEWPKWMADIEKKKQEMDEEERRWKETEQEVTWLKQINVEQKQELNRLKEKFANLQKGNEAI
ncbi:hypothetical protein ARMSODRAFT_980362 [Armillaria solidipes]|uniref:Uncharacterized protein n=1 Tax=Armillaria solidipes TaxID=1076256 RepID=A0A2H3BEC8_9AGAR|nr:hypothetical protein ARMSODRAFT_980362 [Armillaria solidipes]